MAHNDGELDKDQVEVFKGLQNKLVFIPLKVLSGTIQSKVTFRQTRR